MKLLRFALATSIALIAPELRAGEAGDRKTCIAQIKEIATLNLAHAKTNGGMFAKSLDEVFAANKNTNRALLVAPGAKDKNRPSYELVTPGKKLSEIIDPSTTVTIRALYTLPDGAVPVAFADGSVRVSAEPINR